MDWRNFTSSAYAQATGPTADDLRETLRRMGHQPSGPLTKEDVRRTCENFCANSRRARILMRWDTGTEGVRLLSRLPDGQIVVGPWRSSKGLALWANVQEVLQAGKRT